MEELWYKNPGVLFKNLDEFIPKKEYNNLQKINSLARLSMYYTISILLLKFDTKWLIISIIILIHSIKLSNKIKEEYIDLKNNKIVNKDCTEPTKNNPHMNMLPYTDPKRKEACKISDDIKVKITEKIYENDENQLVKGKLKDKKITPKNKRLAASAEDPIDKYQDKFQIKYDEGVLDKKGINPTDPFNKGVNERQFFSMPVTKSHNDLKNFAEELYGDIGHCKASRFIRSDVFENRFNSEYSDEENIEVKRMQDKQIEKGLKTCTKNIDSLRPIRHDKNY